ncbi:hypothetical protein PIB30_087150, partial [Stylosanthes scabra]|nr:hypothetical protein [Stylosanthes scabra]
MKRSQEGRNVASGVASRLHKHQQKLPTQQESCASNLLVLAKLPTQRMVLRTQPASASSVACEQLM